MTVMTSGDEQYHQIGRAEFLRFNATIHTLLPKPSIGSRPEGPHVPVEPLSPSVTLGDSRVHA